MTSANHIVGGVAITGLSLSFWDVNIFASADFLVLTIFASLLPDIDHTKSIIGKFFFPIARWIDRNYGHRTLTHSLSFFVPTLLCFIFFELNFLNPILEKSNTDYSLIFGFAFFSHLILDMLTVHGVPLFYPFLRNPCVIPANPSYRIRSGNMKSEAMALCLFTLIILSSFDLFENGFWTTYNRSFGTIKHVDREFWQSTNMLEVDFSFNRYDQIIEGKGLLIESSQTKLTLKTNEKLLEIDSQNPAMKNIKVQPANSGIPYMVRSMSFHNVSLDSLHQILEKKVFKGVIFGSENFLFNGKSVNEIELSNFVLNPVVQEVEKTISVEVAKLQSQLAEIQSENAKIKKQIEGLKAQKIVWKNHLLGEDLYLKNKAQGEIHGIDKIIIGLYAEIKSTTFLEREISLLSRTEASKFSGRIQFFDTYQILSKK